MRKHRKYRVWRQLRMEIHGTGATKQARWSDKRSSSTSNTLKYRHAAQALAIVAIPLYNADITSR